MCRVYAAEGRARALSHIPGGNILALIGRALPPSLWSCWYSDSDFECEELQSTGEVQRALAGTSAEKELVLPALHPLPSVVLLLFFELKSHPQALRSSTLGGALSPRLGAVFKL